MNTGPDIHKLQESLYINLQIVLEGKVYDVHFIVH